MLLAALAVAAPPKPSEPADAGRTFRLRDGFTLQPVAHEPQVSDPVAAAYDEDGRLYVAFSDVYRVRVLDRRGATVRVVESARAAVRKSPRELEEERDLTLARLRVTLTDVSDSLLQEAARPDSVFALVEELIVDPAGRLWVRTHRAEGSGGTAYDVFNERGEPISWVAVPAVVRKSAFAPDGRLFVIDERDPARPTIVGYEIGFGGRGAASVTPSGPGEPRSIATVR